MDPVLDRIRQAVPGLTSGRIHAMAGDVLDRARDLELWGDPPDYDEPKVFTERVARLRDAARILGVLAQVMEEAEGADARGRPA